MIIISDLQSATDVEILYSSMFLLEVCKIKNLKNRLPLCLLIYEDYPISRLVYRTLSSKSMCLFAHHGFDTIIKNMIRPLKRILLFILKPDFLRFGEFFIKVNCHYKKSVNNRLVVGAIIQIGKSFLTSTEIFWWIIIW